MTVKSTARATVRASSPMRRAYPTTIPEKSENTQSTAARTSTPQAIFKQMESVVLKFSRANSSKMSRRLA